MLQEINTHPLEARLMSANDGHDRVRILNEIGKELTTSGHFSASKEYLVQAEELAKALSFKEGLATALSHLGRVNEFTGEYVRAIEYQSEALKIRQEISDRSGASYSLHYLGDIYLNQGNLSDNFPTVVDYTNKALGYFFESLKEAEEISDRQSIANTYNCIGNSYRDQKKHEIAIEYYAKALRLREDLNDKIGLSVTLNNLGKLYLNQNDYEKTLEHLSSALKIAESLDDKRAIVKTLGSIGNCYLKQENYANAFDHFSDSLALAKQINFPEFVTNAHYALSKIYETPQFEKHNPGAALGHYKEYIKGRDSINSKKLAEAQIGFEFEKKILAAKAEQDKKDAVAAAIEKKNHEILDSINYALRIQQAILPVKEEICRALPASFILYKPKDIVSGDFYFFYQTTESVFIAAADCTGHGVPGALMSMIGSEKLKDAVQQMGDAGVTLSLLNKGIKTALKQSETEETTRDGMDIALCSVDTGNRIVTYAGANRPVWIIRNGGTEIEEIKATKKAIGGFTEDNQRFETHQIKLQAGDTFYLSTDGYADTFSEHNKKLTTKKFKELLVSIQNKSMQEQEQHLDDFIESWRGTTEQVDDILVIGVRL